MPNLSGRQPDQVHEILTLRELKNLICLPIILKMIL